MKVITIIDGGTVHRIPLDELRFVQFVDSPAIGPPYVVYQLVNAPERTIMMFADVGGIDGHVLLQMIYSDSYDGYRVRRVNDTSPFEVLAP